MKTRIKIEEIAGKTVEHSSVCEETVIMSGKDWYCVFTIECGLCGKDDVFIDDLCYLSAKDRKINNIITDEEYKEIVSQETEQRKKIQKLNDFATFKYLKEKYKFTTEDPISGSSEVEQSAVNTKVLGSTPSLRSNQEDSKIYEY